jgi:hypothetical protein
LKFGSLDFDFTLIFPARSWENRIFQFLKIFFFFGQGKSIELVDYIFAEEIYCLALAGSRFLGRNRFFLPGRRSLCGFLEE